MRKIVGRFFSFSIRSQQQYLIKSIDFLLFAHQVFARRAIRIVLL